MSAAPSPPAPIMVRARLTADEWAALRKLSIDRREPVADLVAAALRATYQLTGRDA